ncbi:S-layer homology domain-containing protein [Lysinibacillus pakistanensis]|uniref:S-layer homology domain-containing protein n=1 Tax=Lysinibacillus pakistanensis TaxID=759811 RepID=UPI003D2D9D8F
MQTKKQKKGWKRSLNTFLATVLVASSISFVGVPQEAKAETNDTPLSSPAGVDGAVLWLRPDRGISVESGQSVSEWRDQSNQENHATQSTTTLQPMYRNDTQYNVNFNPMLEFNNKYFDLDVNKLPTGNSSRTIVAVAASENNTADNRYIISWGTASGGNMIGMLQLSGTTKGAMSIYGGSFSSEDGFWQKNVPNELVATYDGTNGALYSKTTQIGKAPQSWNTAKTQARVGRIIGSGRPEEWIGTIGDIIVYDRALEDAERKQISSYLAIKYGYTLGVEGLPTSSKKADYLASDTSVLWDATGNAAYYHSIAGIARDDNGGLLQKQSNSTNPGHQVVIGLYEISDKNSNNVASFSNDMQYLMWGDNNQPFTYTKTIGERAHTERIWKVQNRGNVGQVEFAIPKAALPEKGALLVGNSDTDFSAAKEYPLTLKTINGKEYYTTKLMFTDGQYFTLVTTQPELETATLTQTITDENKVTLIFDQSVTLTDLNGFTITKDGIEIPIQSVSHTIDGNKIILTLPSNNVINESVIKVKYEKGSGNLKGSTNNLPVGNFEIQAVNSFAASLKINEPSTTIVAKPKPDIKGEVEAGSDVEVVLKDKLGNVVPNAGGMASVDGNGNWTYTPSTDLSTGDYTIEVRATKNDKTVTKTKSLTIVNKTNLDKKVTDVGALTPTHYTSESWSKLQEKLTEAKAVLTNPSATQQEINSALQALEDAQNALKAPKPTSVALTQTVSEGNKVTLTFNQEVELTDLTGFTVMVDGTPVTPTFEVDPTDSKKVIFTLPNGTDVTNKEVKVIYNGAGNLKGKGATGAPVENFEMVAEDPYSAAFQITKPDAVTANPKPTIDGKVDVTTTPSTVTIVLKNDKDESLLVDVAATVDPLTGEWTYTPPTGLPDGTYTIIATATNGQQTVTKKHTFTVATTPIVNKVPLQQKVEEAKNLVAGEYTPASWAQYQEALKKANEVLANPNATQEEVDAALGILTGAQNALVKIGKVGKGLGTLNPSTGTLSPSFQTGVTDYTMTVGYSTSVIDFTTIPVEAGATVTTTVNGQLGAIGQIPLQIGENIIVISVKDANGNVKQYTIKVYREAYTGGGSWTPNPTIPVTPTPGDTKTKIRVELEIDGEKPLEKTTVEIERTKHANGDITDFVALTEANAKEAVAKAKEIGNNIARIVLPDVNDEVKEAKVEIPKESLKLLRDNGLSLEISSENGHIAIPVSSMEGIDDNFYFRLVPVKKESERQAIEERARAERVVRETLQSNDVHVVARPMTIETNMPSRSVQVTLPLKGVKIPTGATEREAFLKQLAVFIEHSDGEKKVVIPEVVTMAKGELGLRFTVEKFSTFTIIQVNKKEETKPPLEVKEHEAYIKGFPDGTFGPEKNVTRAQVATMIARILGYTDGPVNTAPFKDIPSDHYAAGAIAFVKERGIMNGDVNGNFRASENITRAQMATVVANFKQLSIEENVAITFNDTKGHWAQWIIEANRAAGIINGRQDGSFAPDEHLTRAQAVIMMNRMFERGPLHGVTAPSFPDVKATHWAFKEIEEAAKSHSFVIDEDGNEQLSK